MISLEEEIGLHRMPIGDSPSKLHDLLQASFRAGLYPVWVVHIERSDSLPWEVRRCSAKHSLVKFHRLANRHNGPIGATRVQFSET